MKFAGIIPRGAAICCWFATGSLLLNAAPPLEMREHLATHLIGKTVENQDALELGKLKDIAIESDTGKPRYGIISSGGIAGVKPRRRLVPAPALSPATAKRSVLFLEVSAQTWAKAPLFKKSELPRLGKQEVIAQLYNFYGVAASGGTAGNTPSKPGANRLSRTGAEPGESLGRDVNLELATALIGESVYDTQREKVGGITDLLLDLSGANAAMAIVSAKSLLNPSECFVVPISSLKRSKENKLLLGTTRVNLQRAPLLTERAWRDAANHDAVYRCPAR